MIAQSSEYTFANVTSIKIAEMLDDIKTFDHFIKIEQHDIINVSLDILRMLCAIHDEDIELPDGAVENFKKIAEENRVFSN